MKRLASLIIAAAAIIFVFAGCNNPTGPSEPEYKGVYGRLAGVVIDSTTGQALEGVTVAITGAGDYSAVTDATGTFLIEDVLPGYYAVSYTKENYKTHYLGKRGYSASDPSADALGDGATYNPSTDQGVQNPFDDGLGAGGHGYIYVNAQQYLYDDPFGEWYTLKEEIALFEAQINANGTLVPGSATATSWTYNEGANTYTTQSGDVAITYSAETGAFTFSNTKVGQDRAYSYGVTLGVQALTPLNAGVSGSLVVVFGAKTENAIIGERVFTPVKDGVKVFFADGTNTYGPALTSGGTFTLESGLPAGTPGAGLKIQIEGFSQENEADGVTYYFSGDDRSVVLYEGGDTTTPAVFNDFVPKANQIVNVAQVYTYANTGDAFIVSHNIGAPSVQNPLLVDGEIELTFSKPIAASSFNAWLERNSNTAFDLTGGDIGLNATWSSDGTTVVLKASNAVGGKVENLPAFEYGHSGWLFIGSGLAVDGSVIRYDNTLDVYTEPKLKLLKIEYVASRGRAAISDVPVLPLGGAVKLTFNKPLVADHPSSWFKFYESRNESTTGTTNVTTGGWAELNGKPETLYSNSVVYVWPGNSSLLNSAKLALQYKVTSSRPNDTNENDGLGTNAAISEFLSPDGIELKTTNLYASTRAENIYFGEALDLTKAFFPVGDTLRLTFRDELKSDYTYAVELYEASILSKVVAKATLGAYNVAGTVAIDTADKTVLTIKPGAPLDYNTKYALAVKITDAKGLVLLNTKSAVFASYNAKIYYEGSATPPASNPITERSSTPIVIVDLLGDTTGTPVYDIDESFPYIAFRTEKKNALEPFALLKFNGNETSSIGAVEASPTKPITLTFQKPIAKVNDVKLYFLGPYATTAAAQTAVQTAGNLFPSDADISAPVGNQITITPKGILAKGDGTNALYYALKIDVEAADGTRAIYDYYKDTALPAAFNQSHLVFATATTVPTVSDVAAYLAAGSGAKSISGFDWDTFTNSQQINTTSSLTYYLKWNSVNARKSLTESIPNALVAGKANYRIYYRVANEIGWSLAGSVAELSATSLNFPGAIVATNLSVTTPTLYGENAYENGNEVNFTVVGHDYQGYVAVSALKPFKDNVSPVISNSLTASVKNAAGVSFSSITLTNGTGANYGKYAVSGTVAADRILTFPEITDTSGTAVIATVASKNLPADASVEIRNNQIQVKFTATAPTAGTSSITVKVTDTSGNPARINTTGAATLPNGITIQF
jgi:hypothetical protein